MSSFCYPSIFTVGRAPQQILKRLLIRSPAVHNVSCSEVVDYEIPWRDRSSYPGCRPILSLTINRDLVSGPSGGEANFQEFDDRLSLQLEELTWTPNAICLGLT